MGRSPSREMNDFDEFGRASIREIKRSNRSVKRTPSERCSRAISQDIRGSHRTKIVDELPKRLITDLNAIDVDDRHYEAGGGKKRCYRRRFDARVHMRCGCPHNQIGRAHRRSQPRQCLAAGEGTQEQGIGPKRVSDGPERSRQVVHCVESADSKAKIIGAWLGLPIILDDMLSGRRCSEEMSGIGDIERFDSSGQSFAPALVGAAKQNG